MTEAGGILDLDRLSHRVAEAGVDGISRMKATPAVLIVDDAPINVDMVQSVLGAEGFRTMEAGDGQTAVSLCRNHQPDLVLLDVVMPGESGFETCARLKSDPATADIPIIFLSALDDVQNKVAGLKDRRRGLHLQAGVCRRILASVRVHLRCARAIARWWRSTASSWRSCRAPNRPSWSARDECAEAACAVYYRPLEDVSGDFFDVIPIASGVFAYFVADVSGHGVSASFLTAAVKALLRQYAGPVFSPEDTMRGVDSVMRQMLERRTILNRLLCSSQSPDPAVVGDQRRASAADSGASRGPRGNPADADSEPLGVFSSTVLQRKDMQVVPGDRFFLYSDGLIESTAGGERRTGLAHLVQACVDHRAAPLAEAPVRIAGELRPEAEAISDDLLLMAVEACL